MQRTPTRQTMPSVERVQGWVSMRGLSPQVPAPQIWSRHSRVCEAASSQELAQSHAPQASQSVAPQESLSVLRVQGRVSTAGTSPQLPPEHSRFVHERDWLAASSHVSV